MKRLTALILSLFMLAALSSCGGKKALKVASHDYEGLTELERGPFSFKEAAEWPYPDYKYYWMDCVISEKDGTLFVSGYSDEGQMKMCKFARGYVMGSHN